MCAFACVRIRNERVTASGAEQLTSLHSQHILTPFLKALPPAEHRKYYVRFGVRNNSELRCDIHIDVVRGGGR